MLTLIQFPWSPFAITVRHMLNAITIPFRLRNIPFHERASIITATKGAWLHRSLSRRWETWDLRCHGFRTGDRAVRRSTLSRSTSFPKASRGLQLILSRYIEHELEMVGFKVNDTYVIPKRPLVERTMLIRHKERKFGKGCVPEWTSQRKDLNSQFAELLQPIDDMLASSPFLLTDCPLFVDYNLYGVLENYLFNGKTKLPALKHLRRWHRAMAHAN